jgi:hypothetical protein
MFKNKRYQFFLFIFVFFSIMPTQWAYQSQWFDSYTESLYWDIQFSCTNQCLIILWTKGTNNLVSIKNISWNWQIALWLFSQDNQFIPLSQEYIQENKQYNLSITHPNISQISPQTVVWVVFAGEIQATSAQIHIKKASMIEQITIWWNNLRTFDTFKPYTINLLQSPTRNGISINSISILMFIVCMIFFVLYYPKQYKQYLFIVAAVLRILTDIRMWAETIHYYITDYNSYINNDKRIYRDRGDFYLFTDFIKEQLDAKAISTSSIINFKTSNTRPLPGSMVYLLYPYHVVINYSWVNQVADIYYQSPMIMLSWNKGEIKKFSEDSFIYFTNP